MAFPDHIQSIGKDAGSVTTSTLAFAGATVAGNVIFVGARIGARTRTVTVTDDASGGSNTYVEDQAFLDDATSADELHIFRSTTTKAATNITVAISGAAATIRWTQREHGADANGVYNFDKGQKTLTSSTSTAFNSGNTATTTQNTELLIGVGKCETASDTWSLGTGVVWTNLATSGTNGGAGCKAASESIKVTSTGAYNADFTLSVTGTFNGAMINTYYQTISGGSFQPAWGQTATHTLQAGVF